MTLNTIYFYFVKLSLIGTFVFAGDPFVDPPCGPIQGTYKTSAEGRQYEAYEGIPYALPPIGYHRFEPPLPMPTWTKTHIANEKCSSCFEFNYFTNDDSTRVSGSEDCLCLDVYVPERTNRIDQSELLPVVVYIPGFSFQFGSTYNVIEEYIMDRQLILVTFNYRLGPLGFLSTDSETIPGNMGLKDQVIALRWVQSNIITFGGNPEAILLVGLDAGAASVHFHYFSPMSYGLFTKGISFSGTALSSWALTDNSFNKTMKLANILGCSTVDEKEIVFCLKSLPAEDITEAVKQLFVWQYNPTTLFGPVVEKEGSQKFLPDTPIHLLDKNEIQDLPWITGFDKDAGIFSAGFCADELCLKNLNDNFDELVPSLFDYYFTVPLLKHRISHAIRKQYFPKLLVNMTSRPNLITALTQRKYFTVIGKAALKQTLANKEPVHVFVYKYRATDSVSQAIVESKDNLGVCLGDSVLLTLLKIPSIRNIVTDEEKMLQKDMFDLWESYIRIDNNLTMGNVSWPSTGYVSDNFTLMLINGPNSYSVVHSNNFGYFPFWDSLLIPQYY